MFNFTRFPQLLAALIISLPVAMEQEGIAADKNGTKVFRGGGSLALYYEQVEAEDKPVVWMIDYCGTPEWVVQQKHPDSHWHKLPHLEEILIFQSTVTKEETNYIARLNNIIGLEITETVFNRDALEPLGRMKGLKSLSLEFASHGSSNSADKAEIDDKFFEFLDGLTELEALTLSTKVEEKTFNRISKLRQLSWLSLAGLADVSADSASALSGLDQLENLLIHSIEDPTPLLSGLVDHRHLMQLWLETSELDNEDVKSIATIKPLEQIYLRVGSIGSLTPFAELTGLKELRINSRECAECDGCGFLENLANLEVLILAGGELPDLSIGYLRGHKQIRELVISAELDSDAMSVLESMPNLRRLRTRNPVGSDWNRATTERLPQVEIDSMSQ